MPHKGSSISMEKFKKEKPLYKPVKSSNPKKKGMIRIVLIIGADI